MKLIPELRFPEFRNEVEWELKSIGEVFNSFSGGTPSTSEKKYYNGKIPFIRSAEINREKTELFITDEGLKNSSAKLVKIGDLLVALYGANSADSAISKIDGAINQAILCLQSDFSNSFAYSFLTLKKEWIISRFIQGGQGNLSGDIVKSITIPFPKAEEQQKIASCLTSLDQLIEAHNDKLQALKDHKRGLMQNLFPQEDETVPKVRFPEFENDGEWVAETLIKLALFRRGSFPQPYGLPEWYDDENGMPFIQVYDVDDNFLLKPTTKRKISSLAAEQSVFIEKGTVIITIQGSIGRVAITQYDAYIDRTLLIFQEFYTDIDTTFFAYVLFLLFEIEKEKAPGGIIKTITKEVLSDFLIKMPSIQEQQKIAYCLLALDKLITAQANKIGQLQLHKKALMQGLFPKIES